MNWSSMKSWFGPRNGNATAGFTVPGAVIEIEPGFVAGARFDGAGSHARSVRRLAVREFGPAALRVSFNRPNLEAGGEVTRAVEAVTSVLGSGGASVGLLVPDGAVRTVLASFESLPDNRTEAEALIRWRVLERMVDPSDEALVSYQEMGRGPEGVELLVVAGRTAVLSGYIAALGPSGSAPLLLLPSTLALLPLIASDHNGGDLMVHVSGGWVSLVVLDKDRVYLWRSRPAHVGLPEELAAEAKRAAVSVRDRHRLEVRRVWLSERPPVSPSLAGELAKALPAEVRPLDPPRSMGESLSDSEREVFRQFGAPVSGLLSNRG